jgi:hypothetical protein
MGVAAAVAATAAVASAGIQAGVTAGTAEDPTATGLGFASNDPLISASTVEALTQIGVFNPIAAAQGSPLAVSLNSFFGQNVTNAKQTDNIIRDIEIIQGVIRKRPGDLDAVIRGFQQNNERVFKTLQDLAGSTGLDIKALLDSEATYQSNIENTLKSALENREVRRAVQAQLRQQFSGLATGESPAGLDLAELREAERQRLERDINRIADEQGTDTLRQARFGNFNPGRALGDIEEQRARGLQDADLASLDRAAALLGTEQQLFSNRANLLSSFLTGPEDRANQLASVRASAQSQTPQQFQAQAPNFDFSGINDAAALLASGIQAKEINARLDREAAARAAAAAGG